jgi:hypothetical protein
MAVVLVLPEPKLPVMTCAFVIPVEINSQQSLRYYRAV